MEKNRICIALDGSDQALEAVRYAGHAFLRGQTGIVLFHVHPEIPESFADLGKEAVFRSQVIQVKSWAAQARQNIAEVMENARSILLEAGFPREDVSIKMQPKKEGISRDILKEAAQGYKALVVGKKGISRMKDLVMGSVADKLVRHMQKTALIVVGGAPAARRALVGLDGSEGAMRAVNCLCALMNKTEYEIILQYIVRFLNFYLEQEGPLAAEYEREWVETATQEIMPIMQEAKDNLVEAGFDENRIFQEVMDGQISRAGALVTIARARKCGTIVVGRRGLTRVQEFLLGRVSTKVLGMANDMAVWVV